MIDFAGLFLIGFFSSWGHCVGMCGGFIVAYSMKISELDKNPTFFKRLLPHLLYHSGRMITYMIIGLLFGIFGEIFSKFIGVKIFQNGVMLIAAFAMIVIGLDMMGVLGRSLSFKIPGYSKFISAVSHRLSHVQTKNVFFLGLLLGSIPCGLVYAIGMKAAAQTNLFLSMLVMAVFALGTLPALLFVGFSSQFLSVTLRQRIYVVAGILVVLMGLWTGFKGGKNLIHAAGANTQHQCHH